MMNQEIVKAVEAWQEAANHQDVARLLELSDPTIEIVGPRGVARGHEVLTEWINRAGLTLETFRIFAKGNVVVMAQHGTWHSAETNNEEGKADVATVFRIVNEKVTYLARYDSLEKALSEANLTTSDEVKLGE
jgi:ketosteroid isomerase-like protein